jgi:hypothetical protein
VLLDAKAKVLAAGGGGGSSTVAGGTMEIAATGGEGVPYGCFPPNFAPQTSTAGNGAWGANVAGNAGASQDCAGGGGSGWIRINATNSNPTIASSAYVTPSSGTTAFTVGGLTARP